MDNPYLISAIADSALITMVFAAPLVIAAIVSWYPGPRPKRKFAFTIVSAALAYGLGVVIYVIAIPFALANFEIRGYLEEAGRTDVSQGLHVFVTIVGSIALGVVVLASVVVPILLRRRYWSRLVIEQDLSDET